MKKVLISYATEGFVDYQKKLFQTAKKFGIDQVVGYLPEDLHKTGFYQSNKKILDQQRGGGYWLWKPYYIIETLKTLAPDDMLFYCDSGIEVVGDLQPLFDICVKNQGLVFTRLHRLIKDWTKRDCFLLMNMDTREIQFSQLVNAGFCLFMNNKKNLDFLHTWLGYCKDERMLTDIPNTLGYNNYRGFIEHRHDQSILSVLIASQKMEVFRDPSQYGNSRIKEFSNSNYSQLLNHQRAAKYVPPDKITVLTNSLKINVKYFISKGYSIIPALSRLYKRIYTSLLIRLYMVLRKSNRFKNSNVYITGGVLKNSKWNLNTSDETYLSGNFDNYTSSEIENYLSEGNIFCDLGANEGYYSLLASKLVGPRGKVYSFEPMQRNVNLLAKNVQSNNIKNVVIVAKAVSNINGTVPFSLVDDWAGNTYINTSPKFSSSQTTVEVETITLDEFFKDSDKKSLPDFIKIDVEGAEYDVLEGAKNILSVKKPVILLATHDFHQKGIKEKCLIFLKSSGYSYRKIENHNSGGFADYLCIAGQV